MQPAKIQHQNFRKGEWQHVSRIYPKSGKNCLKKLPPN